MALKNYDPHLYDLPKYKKMVHYIPISLKSKPYKLSNNNWLLWKIVTIDTGYGENSNRTQILEKKTSLWKETMFEK